jgi:hypothetical protein
MTKLKLFVVSICLAVVLFLTASTSSAQVPQFVAAGSSAIFTLSALAAGTGDPITGAGAVCGAHLWTSKSSVSNYAAGIDPRPGVAAEPGNLWIIWSTYTPPANPATVCVFLSVDSIVGNRLLYASGVAGGVAVYSTISLGNSGVNPVGKAGDNAIPYWTDTDVLPVEVFNLVQGAVITSAFTDIRPEDAQYANYRATTIGYPKGSIIQSSFSTTSAQVQPFFLQGPDPITSAPVRSTQVIDIGAEPVLHIVNTGTATANPGDFGNLFPAGGNVNSHTLALLYGPAANGLALGRTIDVSGTQGVAGQPISLIYREPTSGTYNTFEFQIVHAEGTAGNQESALQGGGNNCWAQTGATTIPPPGAVNPCFNPAYHVSAVNNSIRARAIGTGEMINVVKGNHNAMGYAFWSFSNFRNVGTVKYLTLDGVDPLGGVAYTGAFPQCAGTINAANLTCPNVPFTGVASGNYRNWSILRLAVLDAATNPAANAFAKTLVLSAQDQASGGNAAPDDFLPVVICSTFNGAHQCTATKSNISVFRSHYALPGVAGPSLPNVPNIASNGNPGVGPAESGGDMAGAIFQVQNDADFFADSGSTAELTSYLQ